MLFTIMVFSEKILNLFLYYLESFGICSLFIFVSRQRIGSIGDMDNLKSNGTDPYDLDRLKQEIMVEIRMEINKLKQDIIDGNLCLMFN